MKKILLIGDSYYRRILDPLEYLNYEIILINYNYNLPKYYQPFAYLFKTIEVLLNFLRFKPKVVIFTSPTYITFLLINLFKYFKSKVVIRLGADTGFSLEYELKNINKVKFKFIKILKLKINIYCIHNADKILCTSNFVNNSVYKRYNISKNKIHTIYSHISTPLKTKNIKKDNLILSVTQFNNPLKSKGLKDTLINISNWLELNSKYKYVIIGTGKEYEAISKWAKSRFNNDNLKLVGYINNLEGWYLRAKVFIHISYYDGFPFTVLEAMSYGLPVIANNDMGMKEQISHDCNGFLINNENLNELSNYLDSLINSKKKRQEFGVNSIKIVKNNFNIQTISKRIDNAISELF